jgi:hypothetical protein
MITTDQKRHDKNLLKKICPDIFGIFKRGFPNAARTDIQQGKIEMLKCRKLFFTSKLGAKGSRVCSFRQIEMSEF